MSITGKERIPLLGGGPGLTVNLEDVPGVTDNREIPLERGGISIKARDFAGLPANARIPVIGGASVTAAQIIPFITPSSMAGSAVGVGAASGASI